MGLSTRTISGTECPSSATWASSRRTRPLRISAPLRIACSVPWRVLAQPSVNPAPGIDARMLSTPQGTLRAILKGAEMRRGRVRLELAQVADDGHSVPLIERVDSPMSEADY